ncbi:hypothetical protein ZWY2020_001935 [Hordeum vulgare]|nr:hypothetical protein ZWY2020_001935 [Hordeum vulgare]
MDGGGVRQPIRQPAAGRAAGPTSPRRWCGTALLHGARRRTVQQEIVQSDIQSKADKTPVTVADYGLRLIHSRKMVKIEHCDEGDATSAGASAPRSGTIDPQQLDPTLAVVKAEEELDSF